MNLIYGQKLTSHQIPGNEWKKLKLVEGNQGIAIKIKNKDKKMKYFKKYSIIIMVSILLLTLFQPVYAGSKKININTAIKTELVELKYVGDAIAVRIIEYRKGQSFQKPEELMKVKGIGQKIYDSNKQIIIVKDE